MTSNFNLDHETPTELICFGGLRISRMTCARHSFDTSPVHTWTCAWGEPLHPVMCHELCALRTSPLLDTKGDTVRVVKFLDVNDSLHYRPTEASRFPTFLAVLSMVPFVRPFDVMVSLRPICFALDILVCQAKTTMAGLEGLLDRLTIRDDNDAKPNPENVKPVKESTEISNKGQVSDSDSESESSCDEGSSPHEEKHHSYFDAFPEF